MPGEFHLSIKNNQRRIVDVRELFKNLTKNEWQILELAKQRSEAEKRLKTIEQQKSSYSSGEEALVLYNTFNAKIEKNPPHKGNSKNI